jgi:hypothetical protein
MAPHDSTDPSAATNFDKVAGARTDAAGKHQGKPANAPQTDREPTGEPQTAKDQSIKNSMALPHDRDENTDMTDDAPRPEIEQASDDLAHGLVDTSRGVESNRAYEQVKKTAK